MFTLAATTPMVSPTCVAWLRLARHSRSAGSRPSARSAVPPARRRLSAAALPSRCRRPAARNQATVRPGTESPHTWAKPAASRSAVFSRTPAESASTDAASASWFSIARRALSGFSVTSGSWARAADPASRHRSETEEHGSDRDTPDETVPAPRRPICRTTSRPRPSRSRARGGQVDGIGEHERGVRALVLEHRRAGRVEQDHPIAAALAAAFQRNLTSPDRSRPVRAAPGRRRPSPSRREWARPRRSPGSDPPRPPLGASPQGRRPARIAATAPVAPSAGSTGRRLPPPGSSGCRSRGGARPGRAPPVETAAHVANTWSSCRCSSAVGTGLVIVSPLSAGTESAGKIAGHGSISWMPRDWSCRRRRARTWLRRR